MYIIAKQALAWQELIKMIIDNFQLQVWLEKIAPSTSNDLEHGQLTQQFYMLPIKAQLWYDNLDNFFAKVVIVYSLSPEAGNPCNSWNCQINKLLKSTFIICRKQLSSKTLKSQNQSINQIIFWRSLKYFVDSTTLTY